MLETNDKNKTQEEKYIEKLVHEYGESNDIVVNSDTGEIRIIPNGAKITYPKLPKRDKRNRTLESFMPKEKFVKLYKKSITYLRNNLSYKDFTWFISLAEFAEMYDCILVDDNENYLSAKELSEILNVDYTNFRKSISTFEKMGLIKKIEVPSMHDVYKTVFAYALNPYLCMNGEYVVSEVKNQFDNIIG